MAVSVQSFAIFNEFDAEGEHFSAKVAQKLWGFPNRYPLYSPI
jgi:hypothetical protein